MTSSIIARTADLLQKTMMMPLFDWRVIVVLLLLVIAAGLVSRSGDSGYAEFVEGDYETAAVNLGQRAADGDMVAATIAGDLHVGFAGLEPRLCLARRFYKLAADREDVVARVRYIATAHKFASGEGRCDWVRSSLESLVGRSRGTAEAMLASLAEGGCRASDPQEQLIYLRMAQMQGLSVVGDAVDRLGGDAVLSGDLVTAEAARQLEIAAASVPQDWAAISASEPEWPCSKEQVGPKAPSK